MSIEFRREKYIKTFHNPLNNFAPEPQEVELRFDPLLNHFAVFNPALEDKARLFFGAQDWELVKKLAEASKEQCFMCPPKVREVTPRYPEDFIPDGRLVRGECTLFPNLFPTAPRHAVIAVGEAHLRKIDEFEPGLLADALYLGLEFLRLCFEEDPTIRFGLLCANYLLPAGASLVHPHFQVVAAKEAFPRQNELLKASHAYYLRHGQNFWEELCVHEKEKQERFIGQQGRVAFMASFAPLGGNEILAVIEGTKGLPEITTDDVLDLARGLSLALKGYDKMGYGTFNFTLFLPALDERAPYFTPHLRLITRQNLYENYRTDDYFLQRQLGAELIITPPEEMAKIMRQIFAQGGNK
ncbi:hypothetical protein [Thermodesulfatator autotrophicus]|uniref:Galactose-1-phosphate uridylyltransferase n=1 Tax=Thermodesulfatator autotrophicus TaxID=1795632 RepID=A0A177EAA6_9BACT|nr:hypothetical protein [Thermodesulfatator autotrophicus]OAG28360.1 hypothetical protein TH606_01925 [Thermodesulfatator autotrophicus]